MGDLKSHRLIVAKGFLFLLVGAMAAALLLLEHADLRTAALLAIAIWAFCRFYYFAFYVVQRWVDPAYRFAGLWSLVRHAMTTRRKTERRRG